MAKKISSAPEKIYKHVLNIRLSDEEYEKIKEFSSEKGYSISTSVRQMMFGDEDKNLVPYSDSDAKYKILLAVQQCRSSFKKICVRFNNAVSVYEASIEARDDDGRRILSTSQTVRHLSGLVETVMGIQKDFNQILKILDAPTVHYAARPASDTYVGQLLYEERGRNKSNGESDNRDNEVKVPQDKKKTSERYEGSTDEKGIPLKYKYMFKATITGKLQDDAVEFTTKKGTVMMKFTVKTMSNVGNKETVHYIDIIKVRYGIFEYLKKGTSVTIVGDFDINHKVENNEVIISKTIYADDITLS